MPLNRNNNGEEKNDYANFSNTRISKIYVLEIKLFLSKNRLEK